MPNTPSFIKPCILIAAACAFLLCVNTTSSKSNKTTDARISRVEHGLLPAAIIRGKATPSMNLADRMRYYHVPGVSVAVFDKGEISWLRGYGVISTSSKEPVTPQTFFQAASVSKSLTAFAALRLVQQGKLNLDEDVNHYLTSWKVPENDSTKLEKVTLRRLLSHTAGVTVAGFGGYTEQEPLPTIAQILDGQKPANNEPVRVTQTPGRQFRYSGGGYVIVQLLLVDVTGSPFPELMRKLVLDPLGMHESTFEQPLPRSRMHDAAQPYDSEGNPVQGGWRIDPEMAPAGLWSTAPDLARFAIEVGKAYRGDSKLLSSALAHQMLTYQSAEVYGLGVALGARQHELKFWHSGGHAGYRCMFEAFPKTEQGIAVMTNGDSGFRLIGEIQRAVAQEYDWPDDHPEEHTAINIDPALVRAYSGTYLIDEQFTFIITEDAGKLYLQYAPFGNEPQELMAESKTRFFMTSQPVVIEFQPDVKGLPRLIKVRNGPEELEGKKTSEGMR